MILAIVYAEEVLHYLTAEVPPREFVIGEQNELQQQLLS